MSECLSNSRHAPGGACNAAIPSIGSPRLARRVAARAERSVPAYRRFLAAHGGECGMDFARRPLTDKAEYVGRSRYADLLADDADDTFTIIASAGSTGRSFYWPQLRRGYRWSTWEIRWFFEQAFAIHRRRTLAIVGLALGSWVAGEQFSWALRNLALHSRYPFAVFSPGGDVGEILRMARAAARQVEQIVLLACPSLVPQLLLAADRSGHRLPLAKMRFLVTGEPFPERLRDRLRELAGQPPDEPVIRSLYGSADTGILGIESRGTAALRKLLGEHAPLRQRLGIAGAVPHFFHCVSPGAFLETVGGELCVTRWQGIPLVRYNLHDAARFFRWRTLRRVVLAADVPEPLAAVRAAVGGSSRWLSDLIAVSGRADRCLILGATNLTQAQLDAAVRCRALEPALTGAYHAEIAYDDAGCQHLQLEVECRPDAPLDAAAAERVRGELIAALCRANVEFKEDWEHSYRPRDADPAARAVRVRCVPWPQLSSRREGRIKDAALG